MVQQFSAYCGQIIFCVQVSRYQLFMCCVPNKVARGFQVFIPELLLPQLLLLIRLTNSTGHQNTESTKIPLWHKLTTSVLQRTELQVVYAAYMTASQIPDSGDPVPHWTSSTRPVREHLAPPPECQCTSRTKVCRVCWQV